MRVVIRHLALAALTAAMLLPNAAHGKSSPLTASATRGGLRLTISIPHAQYPQNALALVTLTLKNVGKRPVPMQIGNPQQNDFQPAVEVRDEHGKPSSLPTARRLIPMPGGLPYFVPLLPGQSRTWHRHVVLSGPQFVASQTFGSLHAQKSLTTPPIRVTLTPSSPLVIRLVRHPLGPSAVVQGPSNGHLYYLASDMCTSNGATSVHTNFYWLRAGSTRINSECTSPSEWHVIAGYPGRPVGTLDYTPSTS